MLKRIFSTFLIGLWLLLPALGQQKLPASQSKTANPPADQQPAPREEQDDVVRVTTSLVQIDAVVTKDGKQVTDLTADDFEVFEDGRPQAITNFSYVSNVPVNSALPSNVSAPKPDRSSVGPSVLPALVRPPDPRRTIAIVVDDLGISLESMPTIKEQLRKFVAEQLQPNDLVAIIRTGGEVGALQQFTSDKRLLNRAIDTLRWNPCGRVGVSAQASVASLTLPNPTLGTGQNAVGLCAEVESGPLKATIRALRFILEAMRDLPGRKSMMILSDNLPADIPDQESLARGPIHPTAPMDDSLDADLVRSHGETQFGHEAALRRTAEIAIRSSVVIYAADTRGVVNTGPTAADNYGSNGSNTRVRGVSAMTTAMRDSMAVRGTQLQEGRAGLDLLTRQTGGFLISNTNDYSLARVMRDQEGYYLIGYRAGSETFNRSFHQLKAHVKRAGLTVRTREGYFGLSDKEVLPPKTTSRDQVNKALMSPFGAEQIEVRLTAMFANTKQTGSLIRSLVHFRAGDLTFAIEPDGMHKATFNLSGAVFGDNGSVVHQASETRTVRVSNQDFDRILQDGLIYQLDVPVKKPGAYQFRIAVRDATSSRVGTAGQLLEVPDLHGRGLALSGITISGDLRTAGQKNDTETSSSASASENQISTAGGAMPNPVFRRFRSGSNLFFGYVVYKPQLDKATHLPRLTAEARIFREGKLVYAGAAKPIDPGGQTDFERINVAGGLHLNETLAPGEYILQIVVNDALSGEHNRTASQWIDFEIVK